MGFDRHHHRVGSQDTKVRHHQLRTVLHVQQNSVTFLNALGVQPCRDTLSLVNQLLVAKRIA
jgi:hypothetical protein